MKGKKKKSFKDIMHSRIGGYIIIALGFLLLLMFYPGNNLFTWINATHQIKQQQKQMRRYEVEIMEMDARIRELTTNRDSLEKFARENFHFTEPGEDVYLTE